MAIKQKISTIVINNVLAFIKPFATKTLTKAVEVLLKPCCTLSGEAVVSYNDDDTYSVTITTNESIGFLGSGVAEAIIGTTNVTGVVTEPNTIYFEIVDITPSTTDVDVKVFLPTSSAGNVGVFKSFTIVDVVFPNFV